MMKIRSCTWYLLMSIIEAGIFPAWGEGNTYISYVQDISCELVMSDVDIVTVSSRGQVSIPADIRRGLDLEQGSKLLVVSKGDGILLKKIDAEIAEKSVGEILEPMWEQAQDADLDESDAEELVQEQRRE